MLKSISWARFIIRDIFNGYWVHCIIVFMILNEKQMTSELEEAAEGAVFLRL